MNYLGHGMRTYNSNNKLQNATFYVVYIHAMYTASRKILQLVKNVTLDKHCSQEWLAMTSQARSETDFLLHYKGQDTLHHRAP